MSKARVATIWLDGCSGCHMSFLDIDEGLLALADRIDLVYSPLVDAKVYPDQVDVALVEGAVSSVDDLERIRRVREHTKVIVVLGDCGITTNVPGMRNRVGPKPCLERGYGANPPKSVVPELLDRVRTVHEVVHVDVFVPGCPPSAEAILQAVGSLLDGKTPALTGVTRFGA